MHAVGGAPIFQRLQEKAETVLRLLREYIQQGRTTFPASGRMCDTNLPAANLRAVDNQVIGLRRRDVAGVTPSLVPIPFPPTIAR